LFTDPFCRITVVRINADWQIAVRMAIGDKARFTALLDGYNGMQAANGQDLCQLAERLLVGFKSQHEQGRKRQEKTADDFNLLETLQISAEEIRHSMMLAWLLNSDGTHAQGKRGFSLFLDQFRLNSRYADTNYTVKRERRGAESRVDIEIAARGHFIIYIENKIYSAEGDEQTKREWGDLKKQARKLDIHGKDDVHGFFLTLDRHAPAWPDFKPISWEEIAEVFDDFSELAQAGQVSLFAAHYAAVLRKLTFEHEQNNEYENRLRIQT
jgi:hypothetical protein